MRVAVVTMETAHHDENPRTQRLARLARQLVGAGNEVVVCCNQWWGGDVSEFEQDGITYRRVTSNNSVRKFATKVPFALRKVDPDIVHASYWPIGAAVGATGSRWLGRTPVAVDWYGDQTVQPETRFSGRAATLPSVITVPSRYVETNVRELGAKGEQTRIIPDSIDAGLIRKQPTADRPDIVTARYLDDEANIDMMLLGLAELRDRDWSAMVIGDGPSREFYQQKAAELRIEDRVSFPGALSREVRISHYKAAHVFVQTAERCPFAEELLWALASGCIGIVDYQQGSAAHELVEAFDRGFRTTDAEGLGQAIVEAGDLEVLEYDDRFEQYHHTTVLKQYLDVYDELLS